MARFDVDQLRLAIDALNRAYPDFAEDEHLRADMIEAETDINGVLTLLLQEIDNSTMMVAGITARQNALEERAARHAHRIDVLRDLVLQVMQAADLKKVQLPDATITQAASKPYLVGNADPAELPDEFVRVMRTTNRTAIREALEEGHIVPGYSLSNAAPHLVIKTR
jgi:hypothetical protein